ncbi:hypothetical protein Amn_21700 [Aminobacter sp. Y103A]|nr:hypothetical protein Amn_21700 [Aminobacter sp. SS-2016]
MHDSYGFIAYGEDELYHRGALFSALRLLHYDPAAKIRILTDKRSAFDGYPVETIELSEAQKTEMSFGNRYHFGIKAAGIMELLKGCDRLFFMDTDMYPVANVSRVFDRISPTHSVMRMCEGRPRMDYPTLAGRGIAVGDQVLTGAEPMWNSGLLGVHTSNLAALETAYSAIEQVSRVLRSHTPEQFCIGVALAQEGRTVSPHGLPIRNYSTSGKKRFARRRIEDFVVTKSHLAIAEQVNAAAALRLWRTPFDLLKKQFSGQ